MALASVSSLTARLPSKASCRTTRFVSGSRFASCAPAGPAAASSKASATAAVPLTGAPGPGGGGPSGVEARLTTCCKPCSLTTLRLHVNIGFPTGLPILRHHRLLLGLSALSAACAVGDEPRTAGLTYYESADPASLD